MKKAVFLLLAGFIFFFACKKDNDNYECPPDVYYPLSAEAVAKFPFTGTDTLRFVHRINGKIIDTLNYFGTGMKRDSVYSGSENSGVGFCVREISMETRECFFLNSNGGDSIRLKISGNKVGGSFRTYYHGGLYGKTIDWLDNSGFSKMIGSILLEGEYYFDVNVLFSEGNFGGPTAKGYLLYSTTEGFLQFINGDSTEVLTKLK